MPNPLDSDFPAFSCITDCSYIVQCVCSEKTIRDLPITCGIGSHTGRTCLIRPFLRHTTPYASTLQYLTSVPLQQRIFTRQEPFPTLLTPLSPKKLKPHSILILPSSPHTQPPLPSTYHQTKNIFLFFPKKIIVFLRKKKRSLRKV